MKNNKFIRVLKWIINIILLLIFIVSISFIGIHLYNQNRANNIDNSSANLAKKVTTKKKSSIKQPKSKENKDLKSGPGNFNIHWNKISSNIKAWIYIPGTNINYPILQARDNNYYLNYNLYGNKSIDGEIFFDYRQKPDFSEKNTFIYGHDLYDGTKFSELNNFYSANYFNQHKKMYVYTRNKRYNGTAFAIQANGGFSKAHNVSIKDSSQLYNYVKYLKGRSVVRSNVSPSSVKKMMTLWTCSEHQTTGDKDQIIPAEKSRTFVSVALTENK